MLDSESLTRESLERIASGLGPRKGWDFSRVRDRRDPVPWDYAEVVRRYLQPGDRVLDCGTGGGERFLSLSDAYGWGVGLDPSAEMIATAQENAGRAGIVHVDWLQGRAEAMPVVSDSLDVVLNRHAHLDVIEILRILRSGGLFITQQVGLNNLNAICRTFGCGPGGEYSYDPELTIYRTAEMFCANGATVLAVGEYDVAYDLLDIASLLFLLAGVSIPEDYALERHWRQIIEIIRQCQTPYGIRTNEHRELLIIRKN